jgi:hypothetical protein
MICYRLKHIPTGLYYRPSAEVKLTIGGKYAYVKTNLSQKGKIYTSKPSLGWIDHGFYNHVQRMNDKMIELLADGKVSFDGRSDKHFLYPYVADEWVIEEV